MAFDSAQKGIVRGVFAAWTVTLAAIFAATCYDLTSPDFGPTHILALAYGALVLCLIAAVAGVANHRFADPLDRDAAAGPPPTQKASVLQAILRNTHEQVTLAALVYAIAAIMLPPQWSDAIPLCALLFVVGRVSFRIGYERGAPARAFGFGLTFYPTLVLALLSAISAFG